ncbi:MAG TPA: DUF1571 domain-containing protein, partial [Gemmataceae bacterium]
MRRFLTIVSLMLLALLGLSALGLYGLSQGYFDAPVPHEPPPPPPVLDPTAELPSADRLESLAWSDAPAFLRAALLRYRKEVRGYRATLVKQERLNGKLGPTETIAVAFREDPFTVLLAWQSPPAGMADRALYVAGQNGGKALARGKILHIVHHRDPYSADAMAAGRYALPEFGLAKGTERTLAAWQAAADRGRLKVEYLGVKPVAEAGDVPCYVLRRTCDPPEEDGVVTVEVSFDTDHWLQVGNVLTAGGNQRVAAYYFRDLVLNPDFPPAQFDAA